MSYNIVKILEIEPGAEIDDTVYDQWVKIEYKDHYLSIFDINIQVSEDAIGDYVEMKIDTMFKELEPDVDRFYDSLQSEARCD